MPIIRSIKLLCLAVFFASNISPVFSQTPGGVNTTSGVRYWFDVADFSSTANSTAIGTWVNKGGNSDDLIQSSNSARPTLRNNVTDNINGFPVIRFDGSNDEFTLVNDNDINLGTRTEMSYSLVFKTSSDISSTQFLYEQGGSTRGISFYIESNQLYVAAWNDNNDGVASPWSTQYVSTTIQTNTAYILSMVYDGGTSSNNGTVAVYLNGALVQTLTGIGTLYEHAGSIRIGNIGDNSRTHSSNGYTTDSPFDGDLSEFIISTYAQVDAERILTENYLSAKYNISLSSNDIYFGDQSSLGNFDFEVLGIAQTSASSTSSSANNGGLIALSSPANLGAGESLILGHDNASASSWVTSQSPDPTNVQHINRIWRVTETGDVGSLTLTIDANYLPSIPSGYQLGVLVDDDGNLSSNGTIYQTTTSGSSRTVDINLSDGDYIGLVVFRPAIGFQTTAQSAPETSNASLTVELNHIPQSNSSYSINYATANGTATAGSDYSSASGSLTANFVAGQQTASFGSITVTNDPFLESDETFTVTISSGTGYFASSNNVITHTILDDDSPFQVSFNSGSSSGLESATSVSIPVSLNTPSGSAISVDYAVTGGSATGGGTDYTLNAGTLNFSAGASSNNITFTVNNETLYELDETIEITLSNPSGASLGSPFSHTYTILSNDAPEVSVSTTFQNIAEDAGLGTFSVTMSQSISSTVVVDYTVANGTATNGTDFSLSSGSISILPGNTSASTSFTLFDDCDIESNETFSITLTGANIGTIGTNDVQTVTITNDDTGGPTGSQCGIQHWFMADNGISTSGTAVTQWVDQANSIPATAAGSSQRPTLNSNSNDATFNFNDYLTFDGSSDLLGLDASLSTDQINAVYGFVVFKTGYSGPEFTSNWAFLDYDRSEFFNFYIHGNGRLGFSYFENDGSNIVDNNGAITLNDDRPHLGTFIFDNSITNDTRILADGAPDVSSDRVSNGAQLGKSTVTRYAYIGDGSEAESQNGEGNNIFYDGEIAEIVYFNETMSSIEVNRMHSHLGLKYGIHLSMADDGSTASVDERDYHNSAGTVLWDYSANSSYHNDVAGIVRDDNAPLTLTKSTSTSQDAIVTITASSLQNQESLIWGNDDAALTNSTNTPSGISERILRVWKVQEVGETGSLTVAIDVSGLTGIPTTASEFTLLIDDDGNFDDATQHTTGASLSGNVITFTNVDLDNNEYFSLGYWESIVWNGSGWSNGSGSGGAPNLSDDTRKLVISGSNATLSSDAAVGSVEIDGSSDLTINTNITLEVAEGIENDGTITVNNGGSIYQKGSSNTNSGSGNYNILRNTGNLVDDTRFQYWSSPVQNATMGGTFPGSNPVDFYYYDEGTTDNWASQPSGATMTPGRGYITTGTIGITSNSETRTFDGDINNGPVSLSTSNVAIGDNILTGNPYPSAISCNAFVALNSGINGTLWFWNHSTEQTGGGSSGTNTQADYATWTGLGSTGGNPDESPDNYIQTAQGFFVEASSTNPTITFDNSIRIGANNLQFFKQTNVEQRNRAWIAISNDSNDFNQILIGFAPDATDGIDRLYDGKKYRGHPRIALYSTLEQDIFSIQAFKTLPWGETKRIPLGVDAWITGEHTIYLDSLHNWGDDLSLVLVDELEQQATDLKEQSTYTFTVDSIGNIADRFFIDVKRDDLQSAGGGGIGIEQPDDLGSGDLPTGVEDVERFNYKIYSVNEDVIITSNKQINDVLIYDVSGRLITEQYPSSTSSSISVDRRGIFLVHVTFENQQKIIQKLKL